jgi:prevent-host-death family protein
VTTIGIRELKAKTGKLLQEVSEQRKEFTITNHGRPCGKLVPVEGAALKEKKSPKELRGSYSNLPELDDQQFLELKRSWKPVNEAD